MIKRRPLILVSLLLLFCTILGSCSGSSTAPETEKQTDKTAEMQITGTESVSEEITQNATQPEAITDDTSVFNYGKVNYRKKVVSVDNIPFPDENIGKPVDADGKGVLTLFASDFSDGDITCGGTAVPRAANSAGVVDGVMYLPFSETEANHIAGGWTTWAPAAETSTSKYKQVVLSAELTEYSNNDAPWIAGFIGCFVSNYTFTIPDNAGDGVWFSLNSKSKKLSVYAGDRSSWAWPAGNVSITVPDELICDKTELDVVCTANKEIYIYLKNTLSAKIVCNNATVTVYDGTDQQVYSGPLDPASVSGTHYSVFCHGGGGFGIDEMKVYGCSKGDGGEVVEITATPVGSNKLGCDISNRTDVIGICYSMWFNAIFGDGDSPVETWYNVPELTDKYGFSAQYGFGKNGDQHNAVTAFHFWSKPAQGYYRSSDKNAIRNNMTLLYNAGVDFIILDYTYATSPGYDVGTSPWTSYIEKPSIALLDTIMEMRAEGLGTPYVVFWLGSENMFDQIYDQFYGVDKWQDCFVYWDGKPFIMNWEKTKTLKNFDKFTVRSMYGLRGKAKTGQWSYLEISNDKTVSYDSNKNPEHVSVAVATQETYMSLPTAHGRNGGKFWNEQWQTAFKVHPKIVTVTWWNEWCAQLYYVDNVGYIFTDNYNQEYSRDIEPMEGGHGDQYYKWLCQYISDYRAGNPCPDLTE